MCSYTDSLWSSNTANVYTFVNELHDGSTIIDVPQGKDTKSKSLSLKKNEKETTSESKIITAVTSSINNSTQKNVQERSNIQNIENIRSFPTIIEPNVNSHYFLSNNNITKFDNFNGTASNHVNNPADRNIFPNINIFVKPAKLNDDIYNNTKTDNLLNTASYIKPYPSVFTPHNSNGSSLMQNPRFIGSPVLSKSSPISSPSGVPTTSKTILPPLHMIPNNPLHSRTVKNNQNQADLPILLNKIKRTDSGIHSEDYPSIAESENIDRPIRFDINNNSNSQSSNIQHMFYNNNNANRTQNVENNTFINSPNLLSYQMLNQLPNQTSNDLPNIGSIAGSHLSDLRENHTISNNTTNILNRSTSISEYSSNKTVSPEAYTNDKIFDYLGIDYTEVVNVYDGNVPIFFRYSRIHNYGPLSWLDSFLTDPLVGPLREQVLKNKKKSLFNASNEGETEFRNRFLRYSGQDDIKSLVIDVHPSEEGQNDPRGVPNNNNNCNEITPKDTIYNTPYDGINLTTYLPQNCLYINMDFALQQILKVLPNKKTIWLLVERFFKHVYPLVPYLDQSSFTIEVEKLISNNHLKDRFSEENVDTIHMSQKMDFAVLGTLLITLKLAEVSLAVNDDTIKISRSKDEQYLLNHPLNDHIVNVAQSCLSQFKLLKRCTLPIFQLALLLNQYERFNSLQDGNNSDGSIFIVMLVQMAISIGLNRDPSKFEMLKGKEKLKNLWRKIWYGVISSEIHQFIRYGASKPCFCDYYDTELPFFDEKSSNIEDRDLEKVVIEKIRLNYKFNKKLADVANYICIFTKEANIRKVLEKVFTIEDMLKESFSTLKDLLNRKSSQFIEKVGKTWDFLIYVEIVGLLVSVYHRLFMHFYKKENFKALNFLKERQAISWSYVYANFENATIKTNQYFGTGFDIVMTQTILLTVHKGWVSFLSIYVGAILAIEKIKKLSHKDKRIKMLKRICNNILHSTNFYLPSLKILSKKHFQAWKLVKAHTFLIETVRKRDLVLKLLKEKFNFLEHISDQDLIYYTELTKFKNYSAREKGSNFFAEIKDNFYKNRINHRCNTSSSSLNFELAALDELNSSMSYMSNNMMIPVETWNKPMEEDIFWKNLFIQKHQDHHEYPNGLNRLEIQEDVTFDFISMNSLSDDIFYNAGYDINLPNEGEHLEGGSIGNNNNSNNDATNMFADENVYHMFS